MTNTILIQSSSLEETKNFLKSTFGWNFEQMGLESYCFAITDDNNEPGLNGAIMKSKYPIQPIANSINVDNIELLSNKWQRMVELYPDNKF